MNTEPIETLQLRALEQRSQLHHTASDLREKVQHARDTLRVSKQAREHLLPFTLVAGVMGIIAGYSLAGLFTRR